RRRRRAAPWNRMRTRRFAMTIAAALLAATCASCRVGQLRLQPLACAALPPTTPLVGPRTLGHAHNDYEHPRPLFDALEHGFASVEADLWLRQGQLAVSHDGWSVRGTLDALYLAPLGERIARYGGSVYGDGRPFYLWLDLKQHDPGLEAAVVAALDRVPYVARFADDGARPGAVVVVLTGDADADRALVERPGWRPFVRDEELLEAAEQHDQPATRRPRAYSLRYGRYLSWSEADGAANDDVAQLRCIVAQAHAAGRLVRLWDAPEDPRFWRLAARAGVDFVNTDDLEGVARTLDLVPSLSAR
ncbi:MAG TPA: hypothetical protein VF997_22095, partial [Polyangia bacterium]